MNRYTTPLALALAMLAPLAPAHAAGPKVPSARSWSVSKKAAILAIGYGSGRHFPQYAALDTASSYFRMLHSTSAHFGTSTILLPALWSSSSCPTKYCQGAPVKVGWRTVSGNLRLALHGTVATLKVTVVATIHPPAKNMIVANVAESVTGNVKLDDRPGEAFKPIMLSSVHDSVAKWDAKAAFASGHAYRLPANGWIIQPPVEATSFGLQGGTSSWKKNASTVIVRWREFG